jgi:prepilin-type processing-associated H-X9-DG protein/prepilin-type N-terminal cleavage/methylation domain-containing protein
MKNWFPIHRSIRAFNLVELLVVAAVVSILMAVLLPSAQMMKKRSRSLQCVNNLREIGQAMLLCAADQEVLPYHTQKAYGCDWGELIIPYLVGGTNFTMASTNPTNGLYRMWNDNGQLVNRAYSQNKWPYFQCPSMPAAGATASGEGYSTNVKYLHSYSANPLILPTNWDGDWLFGGTIQIPAIPYGRLERPGSLILVAEGARFDPRAWAPDDRGDAANDFFMAVNDIKVDFDQVHDGLLPLSTAQSRSEWAVTTPAVVDADFVPAPWGGSQNAGWPVYYRHGGLCNALMADGHVQTFRNGEIMRRNFLSRSHWKHGFFNNQLVEAHYP